MIIFGAVDFTAALAGAAKLLGYRVTVCDARAVFATPQRFPMADEVVNDWPHRYLVKVGEELGPRDAVCVLTHDHKFDVPAIIAALETGVGYIGAMGSRRTHADREPATRGAKASTSAGSRARDGARSASTSVPARRRRPPSRSAPRSSPCGPAGTVAVATRRRRPHPRLNGAAWTSASRVAAPRSPPPAAGSDSRTAAALAAEGVHVAMCSRNADAIEAAANEHRRPRRSPRRRRLHRQRRPRFRRRRPRRARRHRHPRDERGRAAPRGLRLDPSRRSTSPRSS